MGWCDESTPAGAGTTASTLPPVESYPRGRGDDVRQDELEQVGEELPPRPRG